MGKKMTVRMIAEGYKSISKRILAKYRGGHLTQIQLSVTKPGGFTDLWIRRSMVFLHKNNHTAGKEIRNRLPCGLLLSCSLKARIVYFRDAKNSTPLRLPMTDYVRQDPSNFSCAFTRTRHLGRWGANWKVNFGSEARRISILSRNHLLLVQSQAKAAMERTPQV